MALCRHDEFEHRYGQMTMALIAQAACFMMRQPFVSPIDQWDAPHLAKDFLPGIRGRHPRAA